MGLYEELSELKKNGTKLDFNDLDEEKLIRLWLIEYCSDRIIGELYGETRYKVRDLREKHGINTLLRIKAELDSKYYDGFDE